MKLRPNVLARAFFKGRLLVDVGEVWIATTLAGLLLYLFQLLVSRSLGPADYSLFGALFGIVYLGSALANAIQVSVAKFVAEARVRDAGAGPDPIVASALLQVLVLGAVVLVIFSLAAPSLASYLHSRSLAPVLATGAVLVVSLFVPVALGAFQGAQRFHLYSGALLLFAGSRLLLGAAALGLKLGINGILAAAGLASLLTTLIGLPAVWDRRRAFATTLPVTRMGMVVLPALVATSAVVFPGSVDLVLVRHFFQPEEAGFYAGASILGRMVLFLPAAVSTVLFPLIARERALGQTGEGLLYAGLGMTILASGSVCLVFVLFPNLAVSLLLGDAYAGASRLVPLYAAAMFVFSLSVVYMYYHLAAGRPTYFLLLLPHLGLWVALPYVFHESLTQILLVLLGINVSLLVLSQVFTHLGSISGAGVNRAKEV